MSDSVNVVQLVKDLPARPRGRACIVLTHEYEGQKEWAEKLARQTDSEHIDLLELFTKEEDIAKRIGDFLVPNLFDFLKNRSKSRVLIISGMEFLKATWTGQPKNVEEFADRIKTWDKLPCLVFVMQYDKVLETYDFGRRFSYTFVIDQKETLAL